MWLRFSSLLLACAFSSALCAASTATDVLTDISNFSTRISSLDDDINAYPASGLAGALAIHSGFQKATSILTRGTADVNQLAGPLSEADGQNILKAFDDAKPTVLSSMTDIAGEASAWEDIPGGVALIASDLNEFSKAMSAFEDALVAKVPSDLKDYASAIKSTIDNAVKTAIAAYVNGSGISSIQAKFSQNPS